MSGNHFMPIKDASRETGVGRSQLYAMVNAEKIPVKTGDDGYMHVAVDAIRALVAADAPEKPKPARPAATGVLLPGRVRAASAKTLAQMAALKNFAKKVLVKEPDLTPYKLVKLARESKLPAGDRLARDVLAELQGGRAQAAPNKSKLPGRPGPGAKSSEASEASAENPLLRAWWDREIQPRLEEQGIRGINWSSGGPLEVEVVTKVTL